jgi:serine/threonine protein kinase
MGINDDASAGRPPHGDALAAGNVLNALPPGYRLHEYSLDGVLGYGGFGITYLATDHNLKCNVAIKEYLPSDQAVRDGTFSLRPKSPGAAEIFHWGLSRFIEEARALATFNHPHIVRVLRFFESNNTAYMVMELVGGQPFGEWVKRKRPLAEADLLAVIRPVLDGLAMIHASGFVHRDIKPGNIHMRTDTDPCLLDFGAARKLVSGKGGELTAIVTPGYAALEQYHSHGHQGPWTDLYSVAAVMYGVITGQRPIEAPARARNDPLPKAIDVGDRGIYSEVLLRAVDWGLAPAEEERPRSVQAFLQALPRTDLTQASSPPPATVRAGSEAGLGTLDAALASHLEAALARHLGPMAAVLVRRRVKEHTTLGPLRTALANEIENETSRRTFLERTEGLLRGETPSRPPTTVPGSRAPISRPPTAPPTAAPTLFDPEFLTAVEAELANHLGPLAAVLVRKSAAKARDRAELFLLLSDHIANADQRRAFIRKSVAAFKDKG